MSYEVKLKLRLENIKEYSIPKRCSSCYAKQAKERRVLQAEHMLKGKKKIRWTIQLPVCKSCDYMMEVLANYRPSKHGPPWRARGNRYVAVVFVALVVIAVTLQIIPAGSIPGLTSQIKNWLLAGLAVVFLVMYYWNWQVSQKARMSVYRDLVDEDGHEFGDVNVVDDTYGPVLIFDNEAYGKAFEDANPKYIVTDISEQLDYGEEMAPIPRWKRWLQSFMGAFRIR